MRLFPPAMPPEFEDGFGNRDILGRKEFGDRLSNIINASADPMVIVLDAPWGAGKTTFIRMWLGELRKQNIPSIYFDAFSNDYRSDAFLALAGEILAFAETLKPDHKRTLENFRRGASKVGRILLRAGLHIGAKVVSSGIIGSDEVRKAGEVVKGAIEEVTKEADSIIDERLREHLEAHKSDKEVFDDFRSSL